MQGPKSGAAGLRIMVVLALIAGGAEPVAADGRRANSKRGNDKEAQVHYRRGEAA